MSSSSRHTRSLTCQYGFVGTATRSFLSTVDERNATLNMALSEKSRRDLFTGLEESIGTEPANNLMELLPTHPADQLVTRTDMHAFGTELRGEMAELRGEMAELRGDMAQLRADMNDRFATAKVETQRLILAGMVANAIAVVTALVR